MRTSSSAKAAGPRRAAGVQRLAGVGVDDADAVEAVGLVALGRGVAAALLRDGVHDDRAGEVLGPGERELHLLLVVAVDRADVLQAEVLEQALRGDDVLDALLHPVQGAVDRLADDGRAVQDPLAPVHELLVAVRGAQGREVVGQPADRRRVGPRVVVDDDDQRPVRRGDVVERLPGHAAGERAVADDGDHVLLRRAGRAAPRPSRARRRRTARWTRASSRRGRAGSPSRLG